MHQYLTEYLLSFIVGQVAILCSTGRAWANMLLLSLGVVWEETEEHWKVGKANIKQIILVITRCIIHISLIIKEHLSCRLQGAYNTARIS